MTPLRLHGYFNSSAAYRVRIALALKGLAWESVPVNLRTGEHLGAGYGAVNPAHLVPALEHEGRVITQSLAIIDYLDALEPEPRLLPAVQDLRTRALEITALIGCDIHPVNNLRVLKYLNEDAGLDDSARTAWYAHWIRLGFDALEAMLPPASDGWCLGGVSSGRGPTIADCFLVPQVANARRYGIELESWPRIRRADAFCRSQPAFVQAEPRHQRDYRAP